MLLKERCSLLLQMMTSFHSVPSWASYNLGILICEDCAGIHRSLGTHISKVKSFTLDHWEDIQQQHMRDTGNTNARKIYERKVPYYYCTPHARDALSFREQWIRAKYERREFVEESTLSPLTPTSTKEGHMFKRGKDDKKFNKRKFTLNHSDGTLKYYVKDSKNDPKASLQVLDLNLCLLPQKIGILNGMQIVVDEKGHTRNIFVHTENSKDLIEWFMAIRAAKFHRLCLAYPFQPPEEFLSQLTHDFTKEGWLNKTGPRPSDAYRKRWFTLDKRKLMYYDDPLDAYPKGEIYIGTRETGFIVREGVPPGAKSQPYCFTLKTPDRNFNLAAETRDEQTDWIQTLRRVISEPMSPHENTNLYRAATTRKKRSSFMSFLGKS